MEFGIVIEPFITVSGWIMGCVLEYSGSDLPIGSIFTADGKQWKTKSKAGKIPMKLPNEEMQKKSVLNNWLVYELEPINHKEVPIKGIEVTILRAEE
jgi:hypothetical protein